MMAHRRPRAEGRAAEGEEDVPDDETRCSKATMTWRCKVRVRERGSDDVAQGEESALRRASELKIRRHCFPTCSRTPCPPTPTIGLPPPSLTRAAPWLTSTPSQPSQHERMVGSKYCEYHEREWQRHLAMEGPKGQSFPPERNSGDAGVFTGEAQSTKRKAGVAAGEKKKRGPQKKPPKCEADRCTWRNARGYQCRNERAPGSEMCQKHGGADAGVEDAQCRR